MALKILEKIMKKNVIYSVFVSFLLFCPLVYSETKHVVLPIPSVLIQDPAFQMQRKIFTQNLQNTVQIINQQFSHPILGFAPMGGSKVTPFKEIGIDGLIIIDFNKPGSPSTIEKTFRDQTLKSDLKLALCEAMNGGSMNTYVVMQTPVAAQILARLFYELEVTQVRVQFYLPKNDSDLYPNLSRWDGDEARDEDSPIITRFLFRYRNAPKEIIFITTNISSDTITWRSALPLDTIKKLAPYKFNWGYLSADGLGFFSKKNDNRLQRGNQEFLDLLKDKGGIILDYPLLDSYNECTEFPVKYIQFMCGRADLEKWGLQRLQSFLITQKIGKVYGYSGSTDHDEVRIYRKSGTAKNFAGQETQIFSLQDFFQVGEDYEYELVAEPSWS